MNKIEGNGKYKNDKKYEEDFWRFNPKSYVKRRCKPC